MKTLLSLFSGGGLADVGCRAAGYTPVGAVEWAEDIAGIYAANLGRHVLCRPVEEVDYRPFAGVSLVWASPCCTNASVAKADGEEGEQDRTAAEAIARCLREARPARFVLENVWGYRTFAAFQVVLSALQECGYRWDVQHVNAADFGVPQTRRRLILRAVLGGPVPPLTATHSQEGETGGLFAEHSLAPWNGWYGAVEDLIPDLPESRFAKWQLERLPADLGSFLHPTVTADGTTPPRCPSSPAFAVQATAGKQLPRAFLVDDQYGDPNTVGDRRRSLRSPGETAFTVMATPKMRQRALLVNGTSDAGVYDGDRPAPTVVSTVGAKAAPPRALLVSNARTEFSDGLREDREPAFAATPQHAGRLRAVLVDCVHRTDAPRSERGVGEPAFTVKASQGRRPANESRAWLEQGRVVQMTPRALARFQSVPNGYDLPEKTALACRVIGNGVPPLLAQRIAESLEGLP